MNFYSGVTLKDLMGFTEHYALNSRVTKGPDGKPVEEVYRAGTPDGKIPPGPLRARARPGHSRFAAGAALCSRLAAKSYQRSDPLLPDRRALRLDCSAASTGFGTRAIPISRTGLSRSTRIRAARKAPSRDSSRVVDEKMNLDDDSFAANAGYFEQRAPWD